VPRAPELGVESPLLKGAHATCGYPDSVLMLLLFAAAYDFGQIGQTTEQIASLGTWLRLMLCPLSS
jgi:hypothetical protein